MTIEKVIRRYDIKENEQLFELLKQSEIIKQEKLEEAQRVRYELINKIDRYLQEHINDNPEKLNESGIIDIIKGLKTKDIRLIMLRYEALKREQYKTMLENLGDDSLKDFCKKMRYIEKEQFPTYYQNIEKSNNINEFTIELLEFMKQNNGQYPSIYSEDEKEKSLAKQFIIYSEDEKIAQRFNLLKKDKDNKLYNPQNIMYKLALERKKQNEAKSVILKSVEFFKIHERRPLTNSSNPEEKQLATEYEKECIEKLGNTEITILNNIFNNRKNFEKTCDAYIKNIKSNKELGISH